MNNLEEISYKDVRHQNKLTYAEWRKQLRPVYGIVWRDIFLGYLGLAAIIFLSTKVSFTQPVIFILGLVVGSVLIGVLLAYLALFLHEAGHFNLHPDKKTNDRLATIFLGILFGTSIKAYRKIHWQHHLHLGSTEDTETSYFNALTPSFIIESFTGIHLLKVILKKNKKDILTPEMKSNSLQLLAACALLHLSIVAVLLWFSFSAAAIIWVAGMLVFFPFFATLRQMLEHRSELADKKTDFKSVNHGKLSRLFASDLFSKVFGAAGFNKHMIHHWDPNISYTRFDEVEKFLSECDTTHEIVNKSRTTYFKTLRKLLGQ
jgi:fatty acid desaturase